MRPMREKIQTKLNSMASILIDDIIVPGELEQQGQGTISAGYYDDAGNKFTFTLTLNVTPLDSQTSEEDFSYPSVDDPLTAILAEITSMKNDIETLKAYHSDSSQSSDEDV